MLPTLSSQEDESNPSAGVLVHIFGFPRTTSFDDVTALLDSLVGKMGYTQVNLHTQPHGDIWVQVWVNPQVVELLVGQLWVLSWRGGLLYAEVPFPEGYVNPYAQGTSNLTLGPQGYCPLGVPVPHTYNGEPSLGVIRSLPSSLLSVPAPFYPTGYLPPVPGSFPPYPFNPPVGHHADLSGLSLGYVDGFSPRNSSAGSRGFSPDLPLGFSPELLNPPPEVLSRRVFVGNIPYATPWATVKCHLCRVANVKRVDMPSDGQREFGLTKGFAIAVFETAEGAARAIEQLNGEVLDGRKLTVRYDRMTYSRLRRGSHRLAFERGHPPGELSHKGEPGPIPHQREPTPRIKETVGSPSKLPLIDVLKAHPRAATADVAPRPPTRVSSPGLETEEATIARALIEGLERGC